MMTCRNQSLKKFAKRKESHPFLK